ncbi:MAG: hypothetical protein PVG93_04110 [Phycisphaerales bacterium]|jgi:hypothetical protein
MDFHIPDWVKYELAERWYKARRAINSNPRLVYGIALACVFILILTLFSLLAGPKRPKVEVYKKAWFYDLNTGKLFTDKESKTGPVKAPSGPRPDGEPAGVRAHVFTYKNKPDEADLYIGYLTKPDLNAPDLDDATWEQTTLVRSTPDANWVSANSPKGKEIVRKALARDERGRIPRYHPPD